jgi:hypothetical protein
VLAEIHVHHHNHEQVKKQEEKNGNEQIKNKSNVTDFFFKIAEQFKLSTEHLIVIFFNQQGTVHIGQLATKSKTEHLITNDRCYVVC